MRRLSITTKHLTRKRKLALRIFARSTPATIEAATLQALHFFEDQLQSRRLRPSTIANYIGTISDTALVDPKLPEWRDFSKHIDHLRIADQPNFPQPLLPHHAFVLCETLKADRRMAELAFASTMWSMATRASDLLQVVAHNVSFPTKTSVRILFSAGKGVKMRRQAYVVHARSPFASAMRALLRTCAPHEHPFATINIDTLRKMMRQLDERYEMRSFRRGALQAMAQSGTDLRTLMSISGHSQENTLLRYLHWGLHANVIQHQQLVATDTLWNTRDQSATSVS